MEKELEQNCNRYEKYFSEALARNKSALVSGFANREFQDLNDIMVNNERLDGSYLRTVMQMSKLHLELAKNGSNQAVVQKALNKHGLTLASLCDENDRANQKKMSKVNVEIRKFGVMKLGLTREQLKDEVCVEANYDQKAAKKKKEKEQ